VNKIVCFGALAVGFVGFGAIAHAQSKSIAEEAKALRAENPLQPQLADEPGTPPPRRRVVRQQPPPQEPPPPPPPMVVQPPPPPPPLSPWYATAFLGANWASNVNWNVGARSGNIQYDTGISAFVGAGYRFTPWLSAELEVGYLYLPIKHAPLNGSGAVIDTTHGLALFASGVLTYPEFQYMRPYIGGGAGFVYRLSTDFTTTNAGAVQTGDVGSELDFAVQGKAGISFRINENVWIGPEYRYHWINSRGNGIGNHHVHSVGGTLKINF
jgi:opacity protein-like surface antigen